ncbi:ATP-binding protein [Catenovulum sediminis]|uniref:histidine kinase n=1 Tax=Catenovulum sediminis TaxID=1740262 RepID=A0ABV1RFW1_9ALTE
MQRRPSLRRYVLEHTLPKVSALIFILILVFIFAIQYVANQQFTEAQRQTNAQFTQQLERELNAVKAQLESLASNDLIINSLIDLQNRDQYISMFFNSFRLGGYKLAKVGLTDFQGNLIAARGDIGFAKQEWIETVLIDGEYYQKLNKDGAYFATPVLLSTLPEGTIFAHVPWREIAKHIYLEHSKNQLVYVNKDNKVLYSSNSSIANLLEDFNELDYSNWHIYQNTDKYGNTIINLQKQMYTALEWIVFILAIVSVILTLCFSIWFSIALSASVSSNTLNEFLYAIRQLKNSTVSTNLPKSVNISELHQLRNEFSALLNDLTITSISKDYFENIINSINEVLVVFDLSGQVKLNNKALLELTDKLKISPDKVFDLLMPKDKHEQILQASQNLLEFNASYQFSSQDTLETLFFHWSRSHYVDQNNQIDGFILVGSDVTKTHKIEQDLHIRQRAIEAASTGIIIVDAKQADLPVIYVNAAFEKITGYTKEEVLGKNCRFLQGEATSKQALTKISNALNTQSKIDIRVENYRKNGELFYNQLSITPVHNIQGEVTHFLGIQSDISAQVFAEIKLQEAIKERQLALEQAQESTRLKSEFLASMSHEIRTPMNGVLGMLSILIDSQLTNQQREYASLAQQSARSLLVLLDDILDFSKIEAGKLDIERIEFDLCELLESVIQTLATKAQKKGLDLLIDTTPIDKQNVIGDPSRIRQILTNLLGNAIKFSETGVVKVTAHIEQDEIQQLAGRFTLCCDVEDSGIGIPEHKVQTLFDSFTQVDSSTTRKYGGSGLGLAISKHLCELMGGEIKVNSQLGKGSCFTFKIQLLDTQSQQQQVPNLQGAKILIYTTNNSKSQILKQQLEKWQACVQEANTQDVFFSMIQQQPSEYSYILLLDPPKTQDIRKTKAHEQERMQAHNIEASLQSLALSGHCKLIQFTDLSKQVNRPLKRTFNENIHRLPYPYRKQQLCDAIFHHDNNENSDKQAETSSASEQIDTGHTENYTILLVEDNEINQQVALAMLQPFGVKVEIAENGQQAIEKLNKQTDRYQLILMDCQMPVMDGYQATQQIRLNAQPQLQHIPIVAMTANAMKGDREKCLAVGMDDYIVKPINPDNLAEILQKWLFEKANLAKAADDN